MSVSALFMFQYLSIFRVSARWINGKIEVAIDISAE